MFTRSLPRSSALLVAFAAVAAGRAAGAEPGADEVLRRADAILAPDEFEADITMIAHRGAGTARRFTMHAWKKGRDRVRVRFSSPPDDRGSEVLRIGDNMWNYLPNLGRAIRISPKQEFHGGDFNNTDVLRVNLAADYGATLLAAASPDEYLLELRARDDSIAYHRILYWVRKRDFMPLRQEFFTRSGKLIRKLELSEPRSFGGHVRPARMVMHNMLVPSRYTEMTIEAFQVEHDLDGNLFQLAALGR